jgi:hypothetical protein
MHFVYVFITNLFVKIVIKLELYDLYYEDVNLNVNIVSKNEINMMNMLILNKLIIVEVAFINVLGKLVY